MGKDDLFKKRRKSREARKAGYKRPKANSYLIVTEGKCSEPYYFRGIQREIEMLIGGDIEVIKVPELEICGQGSSTCKLIEITDQLVNRSNTLYQHIWVLFDKDDFNDFDEAIKLATTKGYHVGWSNPCFEYWIYLHFYYSDAALHRQDYVDKLNSIFRKNGLGHLTYEKNYEDIYELVNQQDGVLLAIRNAKKRMSELKISDDKSMFVPGTTIYQLVEELRNYIYE